MKLGESIIKGLSEAVENEELKEYDSIEAKQYITRRMGGRPETEDLSMNLAEAVSQAIDCAEDFFEKMDNEQRSYSSDDELEYIMEKTGLGQGFLELLLWYKMCYEMELDIWEHVENCLTCGGGPLYEKEIPGEDFTSKIVCRECGEEMISGEYGDLELLNQELLCNEETKKENAEKFTIDNDDNLAIVKDFDHFCRFIDDNKPLLSKKKEVLGKKDAFNLNSQLHFKREVAAPTYQQEHYYALDLLYHLALAGNLYRKIVDDSGKKNLERTEGLDSYEWLNDYEKYVFLLKTYWCDYDLEKSYHDFSLHDLINLVRNLLIIFAKSNPGERIEYDNYDKSKYICNCFSFDFKIVVRFSCFGFCTFEWAEEAKNSYDLMIKTIIPTELGRKISHVLVMEGMPYYKHTKSFSHFLDIESTKKKIENEPAFYHLLAGLFPQGAVQKTVSEARRKKTAGAYMFKVALTKKIWRKIKISSQSTLEDLHLAIQDAFQFDNDHLYAFYLNEGKRPVSGVNSMGYENGPFTDEVILEDCHFYPGEQFSYLFDFGDMWKFKISLLEIDETGPVPLKPEIIESKGEGPEQYAWYD
ncbi:IS1096 element passenger TnpR family protein [Desulfitibacter alkalitolerans]|uniref:IS1096 element passenger TnpR family protein n=1 Tax=Desulfitibacter alkalitolerans TaxID=264641 RepID=UPI0004826D33|nr:hypothetical protein [Desulfitibacter alkalitolerans]